VTGSKRKIATLAISSLALALAAGTATVAQAFPNKTGACSGCHGIDSRIIVTATQKTNDGVTATYDVSVSDTYGDGVTGWATFDGATNIRNQYGAGTLSVPVGKNYTVWGVAGGGGAGSKSIVISPVAPTPPPAVDTVAPVVSLTSPANGATVSGLVALTANATDAMSGVARVEFRVDGVLVGTDAAAPYTGLWDSAAALAGNHVVEAKAFDNAGLSAASSVQVSIAPPAPVDVTAPVVSVSAPANGATVSGTVALTANATDAMSGVARVEFRVDGVLVGTDTSAPFAASWNSATAAPGTHVIEAKAFDNAGLSSASTIQVSIAPPAPVDVTAPVVSVSAPANGATVSGTVGLSATATDDLSGVARVEFRVDGVLVGTDTSAPFAASWNSATAAPGTHVIEAKAFDNAGLSSASTIQVSIAAPPVVQFSTLTVTATSQSGTALRGAKLVVKNTVTGVRYTGVTAVDGTAKFAALPFGTYSVQATARGHKRATTTLVADTAAETLSVTLIAR